MQRAGSPVVGAEPLLPDYEGADLAGAPPSPLPRKREGARLGCTARITREAVPGDICTAEQQAAVAFGLFTFHASAGRMAFFAPTRAAAGWWTRPRVASADGTAGGCPPPPPPRTKWTRRVPHPVLIGHAASLSQVALTEGGRGCGTSSPPARRSHWSHSRCRPPRYRRRSRRARVRAVPPPLPPVQSGHVSSIPPY